ncbi:phage tail tube protein [Marisediminicola sp. LYQ134]|uniref:phage tail tube protein n=1 Tax=Marisediminicola sp. LYQ134 TaxID=3391061 RepID=UPI003983C90D
MNQAVPLPAGSTLGKSFEYGCDINLGTFADPIWQSFRRISGFQPTPTPQTQDAQTYDDRGAPNSDVTGWSMNLAFIAQVNRILSTGLYLPEVEAILARTGPDSKGELAVIEARWYHKPELGTPNPTDAGQGLFTVATTRQNTGPAGEIEQLSITLTGKGSYSKIPNPFTGWDVTAPVVSSVTPEGANDGALITVSGSGLLGATSVTIDGAEVPEFLVFNGASLVAQLPVGDAGAVPVVVTTPGGTSSAFTYTRGA